MGFLNNEEEKEVSKLDIQKLLTELLDRSDDMIRTCKDKIDAQKKGIFDLDRGFLGPNLMLEENPHEHEEFDDHLDICQMIVFMPYLRLRKSSLSSIYAYSRVYVVGQIYFDAINAFYLDRLRRIKHFTHLPFIKNNEHGYKSLVAEIFVSGHSRFIHSLTAAVMIEIWMRWSKTFSESQINTAITMALLHDASTNAFGDTMKYFRRGEFDEEKNLALYIELIKKYCAKSEHIDVFQKKYHVDVCEIINAISYKIPNDLYKIFDIFDKLNYTAWDFRYIHPGKDLTEFGYPGLSCPEEFVNAMFDMEFDHDLKQVVWNFSENLMWFVFVRSILSRHFYFNCSSRMVEMYLAKKFEEFYPKYILQEDMLLLTEEEILRKITEFKGMNKKHCDEFQDLCFWATTDYEFIAQEILSTTPRPNFEKCHEQKMKFKSGLDWLVKYKGKICQIRDTGHPLVKEIWKNTKEITKPVTYYLNKKFA